MAESAPRRLGRLPALKSSLPSDLDWERSVLLQPRLTSRHPELVSDGSGLPFSLGALADPGGQLDADDPAVGALIAKLAGQRKSSGRSWVPWKRGETPPERAAPIPSLAGWRALARTDDEILFARGRPPQLVTVAMSRDAKRGTWTCVAVSGGRALRTTREGIRASGWRLDPTREPDPAQRELRVLVTEQTWAGGKRADSRLLAPDLHVGSEALVLTMFVTPRPGFQVRSPNPETPARIALPGPAGSRRLIDGALYEGALDDGDSPALY